MVDDGSVLLLVDNCSLILWGLLFSLFNVGCVLLVVYGSWFVGWYLLLVVDCFGFVVCRVSCVLCLIRCLRRSVWNVCVVCCPVFVVGCLLIVACSMYCVVWCVWLGD